MAYTALRLPKLFAAFLLVEDVWFARSCQAARILCCISIGRRLPCAGTSQPAQAANLNRRAEPQKSALSRSCSCGCVRRKTTKSASGLRSWSTDLVAAAATDVIKIQPLFYVFSHVCEWKRKSEKRGRKRRRTSARTRRYVRRWTFETDRRKKRIIFSCFFVFLSFFLYSFLFGLRDISAFLSALFLCSR